MRTILATILALAALSLDCRAQPPLPAPPTPTPAPPAPKPPAPNPAPPVVIPSDVLAALAAMEAARENVADKQAAADANRAAQNGLDNAAADSRTGYAQAVAAYIAVYNQHYPPLPEPPGPTPTPPVPNPTPPVPPAPPTPTPPAVKLTLTLISTPDSEKWCAACNLVHTQTVPGLAYLGSAFQSVGYGTPQANKLYGDSNLIPRWVLDRGTGAAVEKKVGVLTPDQIKTWIGN